MHRRVLALLLALCLLSGYAGAAEVTGGSCGEAAFWHYSQDTKTLTLSGTGETLSYTDVVSVPWYPLREQIEAVVVCPGITALGDYSFAHLKQLRSLSLPEGLEGIGAWCFWRCESLPEIRLPASLEHFGSYALRSCYSLSSICIPENPLFFTDCHGVLYTKDGKTLVRAPQKLQGTYAVPVGVQRLGADSFGDCGRLEAITLPEGLTTLEDDAFYSCAALSAVTLPKTLEQVGAWTFGWCGQLQRLSIPGKVKALGGYAFAYSGLGQIAFSGSAPAFGEEVFCYVTAEVHYPGYDPTWEGTAGKDYGGDMTWVKNPFRDVNAEKYYYDAVLWAYEKGITTGTSLAAFSPDADCTRGQIVTFLWRAAGEPEPTAANLPFADVEPEDFCYKAVLWAVEKGITKGTSSTAFNPKGTCSRAQAVTFLWRAAGEPAPTNRDNPFADVTEDKYYCDAVLWAVEKGITKGIKPTQFAPNKICSRGQIVTFLYRGHTEF